MSHIALLPDDPRDENAAEREAAAMREQAEQVHEAERAVRRSASEFLEWPWAPLSHVMGAMGPGTLGFVCAASGAGKTSFLVSAARRWFLAGKRILFAGFESRPHILRTQWACRTLGIDAGHVLGGRAEQEILDWRRVRERLAMEIRLQHDGPVAEQVRFAPFRFVNVARLAQMFREAADFGADVVIIDHIDHVDGGKGGAYESSLHAVRELLTLTQDHELRVVCASQTNLANAGGDPLRFHRPVHREHVKFGNHKLEVADFALGLYRPLKPTVPRETLTLWKEGRADLAAVLEHGVTELNVMKHRLYGTREGERIRLGFSHGDILDAPLAHGDQDPPPAWYDRG